MEIIASGGAKIVISDISSGKIIATLEEHRVRCVSFSPCGAFLASGSTDCSVILWDCETWTRRQTFTGHDTMVISVNFNRAGDRIASTSINGKARVWNLVTNVEDLKIEMSLKSSFLSSTSFNSSGSAIAVPIYEKIVVYDAYNGEMKHTLNGHVGAVTAVQFSADDRLLASAGSEDMKLIIWDVISGRQLQVLSGHGDIISRVCFNADASRIVSSSFDETARIWDVSAGDCLLMLVGYYDYVWSCCFSEDGSKVITSMDDGSVKVWDSCTGEELRTMNHHNSNTVYSVSYRPMSTGSYI